MFRRSCEKGYSEGLILTRRAVLAASLLGEVRQRRFRLRYAASVAAAGARMWLPVPKSGEFQDIASLAIDAPHRLATDARGNRIAYIEGPSTATLTCEVTRREHRMAGRVETTAPAALARHLEPERLVPLDAKIRDWALAGILS